MSDPFDSELAALRKEVGEFVLEVLQADHDDVVDRIADGLTAKLAQNLKSVTALNERELAAIEGLRDALRDAAAQGSAPALSTLSSPPPRQAFGLSQKSSGPRPLLGGPDSDDPEDGYDDIPERGLKIWRIAALSSTVLALVVLVVLALIPGGPFRRAPAAAVSSLAATEDVGRLADADGWTRVMATARTWQGDTGRRDLIALCGRPEATGCSLQEAEVHWAQNPQAAREAATIVERVLTNEGVCRSQIEGQTPQEAQARLVSCLLERPLP